jgi:hypothetical protein
VELGLVLQSASAHCANFFFSAAGNDTLDCMMQATACATIAKANSLTLTAGSTLNFRGGHTFAGCLTINRTNVPSGGSPGNPIVVGSYGTGMARMPRRFAGSRQDRRGERHDGTESDHFCQRYADADGGVDRQ